MRREDPLPRTTRDRVDRVRTTWEQLEQRLQRSPSSDEVAAALGVTPDELAALTRTMATTVVSMQPDALRDLDLRTPAGEPDLGVPEIAAAVRELPRRQQIVVALSYLEELTFAEIAEVLQVSESQASRLHTRASATLREAVLRLRSAPD